MLEAVPPGQQPMMSTTTAWIGMMPKANDSTNPVRGMIPNWQRKPMKMPHGRLMCPRNFLISTLHPMENMTKANRMVSTMLKTVLRMALKLLSGATHESPSQTVALAEQPEVMVAMVGFAAHTVVSVQTLASWTWHCGLPRNVMLTSTGSNF